MTEWAVRTVPGLADALQRRHQAGIDGGIQIGRLATVETDRDRRHIRAQIGSVVDVDGEF
jgi:hypothetical protein